MDILKPGSEVHPQCVVDCSSVTLTPAPQGAEEVRRPSVLNHATSLIAIVAFAMAAGSLVHNYQLEHRIMELEKPNSGKYPSAPASSSSSISTPPIPRRFSFAAGLSSGFRNSRSQS
jgi:hypothetical protein